MQEMLLNDEVSVLLERLETEDEQALLNQMTNSRSSYIASSSALALMKTLLDHLDENEFAILQYYYLSVRSFFDGKMKMR